ncbi:hypothetical protein LIS82_27875 (plasmid) [Cytobacillus solani]|uniref:hypothetical protein n=1 Tax=Cytobacillus solani TaxID=1637975 RepID=UPI002079B159|nr:hypothetical protein [Cytobacillus solani]USK57794.1 hypothetical protein LIS82_27875 [Cytobacillus solani]
MINILIYIAFAGFGILLGIYFYLRYQDKKKIKRPTVEFGSTATTWQVKYNLVSQQAYIRSLRIPLLKKMVMRIRLRIETLSVYDEYALRREVMRIIFTVGGLITFIVLGLLAFRPGWLVTFWVLLGVLFLSGILIDFFVYRVEAKLLNQLKEFNNRVRFFYQQTKMVDEAIYESIQFAGPEMKVQANRIYSILTSADPEEEMAKYEEVAPTRFLKVIAGLSVLVKDQGDVIDKESGKGSAFLRGLTSVNQEINTEILYRSKLSYSLRGISVLSLVPIFFALPIQKWATSTFPVMRSFYESRLGFFSEVTVYGIALLSYLLIRKMREVNEAKYHTTLNRTQWEKWLLEKVPGLLKLVKSFSPNPYSKEHFKLTKLIKDANSPLKIEWLTLQKMLHSLGVIILLISGFTYAHAREKKSILYSPVPENMFAANVTAEDQKSFEEMTTFDRQVIEDIQQMEGLTPEMVQAYVAEQLGINDVNDQKVKQATSRIIEKWLDVQDAFLKWWEVLIAIAVAFITWNIPVWTLMFQKFLRYKDMENEVHQHLVLISILREFDRMSVYILLTWMDRFAVVFKEPILEAIQVYDGGPEEALDQLTERISFEPFQQIIERLKLAVVRISIKESFDDIDMEREFYLEQRKEANERSIESKGSWAEWLGMAPIIALSFLYLVIPLIYISVVKSQDMIMRIQ